MLIPADLPRTGAILTAKMGDDIAIVRRVAVGLLRIVRNVCWAADPIMPIVQPRALRVPHL